MKNYHLKRLERVEQRRDRHKQFAGVSAKEMLEHAWKPGYPRLAVEPSPTGGHIVGFDIHGKLSPHRPLFAASRDASGCVPDWAKPSVEDYQEAVYQAGEVVRHYRERCAAGEAA